MVRHPASSADGLGGGGHDAAHEPTSTPSRYKIYSLTSSYQVSLLILKNEITLKFNLMSQPGCNFHSKYFRVFKE